MPCNKLEIVACQVEIRCNPTSSKGQASSAALPCWGKAAQVSHSTGASQPWFHRGPASHVGIAGTACNTTQQKTRRGLVHGIKAALKVVSLLQAQGDSSLPFLALQRNDSCRACQTTHRASQSFVHLFNHSFNAIQPATQVSIRAVQRKSFLTGLFYFSESAAVIGMRICFKHLKVMPCFGSCGKTTSLMLV